MFVISPHAAVCEIVNLTTLAAEKVTALKGYKKARLQNKELEKSGIDCVVSVNVSGLQISDTKIVAIIKDALQNSGLAPNKLIIEITESLVMEDLERGLQVLEAIRDIGVSVSIDDFGTGYSSLSYLKNSQSLNAKSTNLFYGGFPQMMKIRQ